MTELRCTTTDGHEIVGDLHLPAGNPLGGVVVCHPHPQYGGDRHHPIVTAICEAAARAGVIAYRFDFRSDFGGGVTERRDVIAALDAIDDLSPGRLAVAGYSFGATVALSTRDERIGAIAAIAPPFTMFSVSPPGVPCLVMTPRHDQFCPPERAEPVAATWPQAEFVVIESADHFLLGHATSLAERSVAWLSDTLGWGSAAR